MIGVVVTGHGHFPTGLLSAVELVAGTPENMRGVDFESGQSTDDLKANLKEAINSLDSDDVLILADLVGGSPFNMAAVLKSEIADKHIKVMAGVNMAALVEATFSRNFASLDELAELVEQAGTAGIADMDTMSQECGEPEFEDGL